MNREYLFQSKRLGFRNWQESDIEMMAQINSDKDVMEFFPAIQSVKQTRDFVKRMQKQFAEKDFCYFAVDKLEDYRFIGFIGLSEQNYEADFTPCIDIGWRIKREEWGKGFATEGAKRCIDYAFYDLSLKKIYAVAPVVNAKSEHIMKKIGMRKTKEFKHPLLKADKKLQDCVLYEINKTT